MKRIKLFSAILLVMIIVASCQSSKKIPYLQVSEATQTNQSSQQPVQFDARIVPNDLLNITVNASDKEAGAPFNLTFPTTGAGGGGTGAAAFQKYLVDNEGYINFPTVGLIKVEGMTRRQAEEFILNSISSNFIEKPIVIVSFTDFKVTVLGEVKSPGTFTVPNEKVNILQALSLAGDMSIYGKRDNVKIFREHADGRKEVIDIDLNERDLLYSRNFYLQQNDVLYVQPNKVRAQASDIGPALTLGMSSVGILISVTNLIINLTRQDRKSVV